MPASERVAAQQSAIAEFGRYALASRDIAASVERAVDVVVRVLRVPSAAVVQALGPGRVAVLRSRGPLALDQIEDLDDAVADSVEHPGDAPAYLAVTVPVEGRPWGRMVVADDGERSFGAGDADFLQSMANVLAAALERERVESGRVVKAEFGRFALESRDVALTLERAVDVVVRVLEAPIGAVVQVSRHPGRLSMPQIYGPVGVEPGEEYDIDPELAQAVLAPEPLVIEDAGTDQRFSSSLLGGPPARGPLSGWASLSVPLHVEGRVWGRLLIADSAPRRFRPTEADVLISVGHMVSAALERDRVESAHAAVAEFGRFALGCRDVAQTVARAAEVTSTVLAVPLCTVIRRLEQKDRFELVGCWGDAGMSVGSPFSVPPQLGLLHDSAAPLVVADWLQERRFPPVPVGRAAGVRAVVSVTVLVQGAPWGRLGVFDTRPRAFTPTEVDVVHSIANVLAAALERGGFDARLRRIAQDLQQALLPAELPSVPGIETAARYAPAGSDELGGDWYDVLVLPRGGIGLVMGDVEGHDSTAAAVMGQVRNVVRAHAAEGHGPAEVLTRVNRFVVRHTERLVTCCYAELHPAEGALTAVSAGHPAPMVAAAGAVLHSLDLPAGLVLGLDGDSHYTERTTLLPPGATVLMVTDGLVDDVAGAVHRGLPAFAGAAFTVADLPVQAVADALMRRRAGAPVQRDDAALLVVRLTGQLAPAEPGGELAQRVFGPFPESAPAARRFVHDILGGWELTALEDVAALAVSELVTNTVLHTTSLIHLTLRRTGAGGVWIGVHDDSDRLPGPRPATDDEISGRGLGIVESLADAWGVQPTPGGSGKTVWLELTAPSSR